MQYHQQHKMDEDESSSLEPCSNLFSMRQYVLLSRQKDIFQNWPFAEKYLRLCLNYGVSNVLPPLEARGLLETTSISFEKKNKSNEEDNDNDHDHTLSFESTISNICEKIKLMTLSCNDSDNACISGINNIMNNSPVNPSILLVAPKKERSRKWRRKMKSMAEIFATAKRRTLEESDELSWTADSITSEKEVDEYMQGYEQVDFEKYCCDSNKAEIIDDGEDCKIRLTKRRRKLKPWSNSSYKATVITKNRSRGCNRKKQEMYSPKSGFMLQDSYIYAEAS